MRTLNGRTDKRRPIAVVVYLAHTQVRTANGSELTCTDNISLNGARVISNHPWETGEMAQLTPLKEEATVRGKVVYCKKFGNDRYFIGLNIQGLSVRWPSFRTYIGA
ncbi:MAG: hypothetical protein DMG47_10500 [Acidobacteria bacterium]|nr:MAG: hypothetical protein DMG47_10500 [Acidobacteriota bacterium]